MTMDRKLAVALREHMQADTPEMIEQKKHLAGNLQTLCHGLAVASGWWHDPKTGEPINPKTPFLVGAKLMLCVSELGEACEGDRKNLPDDKLPHRSMLEVELADCIIRCLDLAGALELDVGGAIIEKLFYNMQRADHKPENRSAEGGKTY